MGDLGTHLSSFGAVEVVSNNAVNFVAVLDQDKTSINKDQMPTPPTTKPTITPPTITPPTNPTTPLQISSLNLSLKKMPMKRLIALWGDP